MSSRKLTTARWLATHVLIAVVAASCVGLGLWQLDRLEQVRQDNARSRERLAAEPATIPELGDLPVDDRVFRRVVATGTYVTDEEVLQRSRQHQGVNGWHVLTPLDLGDGTTLLVRRGWVALSEDTPPVAAAAPPAGTVEVTGWLEPAVTQPGFGAHDPAEGTLTRVFHADTERLDPQVTGELYPLVVHLEGQMPPQPGALPYLPPAAELDEANHLSYALQWFSFAAIAVIGYGFVVRSRGRTPADDEAIIGPPDAG